MWQHNRLVNIILTNAYSQTEFNSVCFKSETNSVADMKPETKVKKYFNCTKTHHHWSNALIAHPKMTFWNHPTYMRKLS